MTLFSGVKTAVTNLRANKRRSFLTMLGIIIGTASVIIIMSVGAGAQSLILNELSGFGSNLFGILPGASDDDGPPASVMGINITTLKLDEIEDIIEIPHVESVTAYVRGVATLTRDNRDTSTNFVGVNAELPIVENAEVANGRFFTADEDRSLSRVVVLGSTIAEDLFLESNPIGETVKIKKNNFKVIGVMKERGTVAFENKDSQVYIPVRTAQKILLGINHVSLARGKVDKPENMDVVMEEIRQMLRKNHNIENPDNDDFSVRSLNQALDVITSITDILKLFLAGIAGISLVVGGVGIMNIMLVTITERIKEIGLRKAVGAGQATILKQFLIESATITIIGGIIGILFGIIFSWLISIIAVYLEYKWDFVITVFSVLLGLGVSALVGIIFGLHPAYRASKMEPVEALRAE